STILQILGQEITLRRGGRLVQGAAVLGWAAAQGAVAWTPASVAILAAAVVGGACLFMGLFILQATSAFWTVETLEVWNTVTHGGNYASQYPTTIYRRWFRGFFTWVVPLALVSFVPSAAVLGRADASPLAAGLAPLAGVAFLLASLGVWRLGVRRYTSTG